jgi:biopolymer transport protein ExbD
MSAGGNLDKGEPNLVPLLDIVLQLIMFFIISANFVMEQVNETIKLPNATAAKSLDAAASSLLFLNVDEKGRLLLTDGLPPRTTPNEFLTYLEGEYRTESRQAQALGLEKVETTIIIRGDYRCKFSKIYEVMRAAKLAGFENIQLRAMIEN